MTRPQHVHTAGGFTLLELLVVLTIAGLLVAAVPPMISAVIPGAELKGATRELAVSLRDARFDAVSRGVPVNVRFMTDPTGYTIDDAAMQSLPRNATLSVVPLTTPGIQLQDNADPMSEAFRLRFHPDGSSSGARISLSRGNHNYSISVGWLMGRVTISQGDAGDL